MFDPFVGLSDLAPQQLKFRARVIQAHLDRWSLDELLRGRHFGEPPHPGVQGPRRGGYDPNQPRVPVGHPDGGQWTDDERRADNDPRAGIRFAANERLPIGRRGKFAIALEIARRLIEAFRVDNAWDLFGRQEEGIVAVVTINGKDIYGTNSEFGDWQAIDHAEARRLRANIVRRYPYSAGGRTLGQMPLNALFHAETNALLRAAREGGGSLAGRTLEVFVDGRTCNNCEKVLRHVGLELGNPTVTFINIRTGRVMGIVRDGKWNRL